MKTPARLFFLSALLLAIALPAAAQTRMQVVSSTPIRARADASAPVLGTANPGEILFVDSTSGSFSAIEPPDRIGLWINKDFVEGNRVIAKSVQMRTGPGLEHDVAGSLSRGAAILKLSEQGEWLQISPPSSASVYVLSSALQPVPVATTPIEEVETVPEPGVLPVSPAEPSAAPPLTELAALPAPPPQPAEPTPVVAPSIPDAEKPVSYTRPAPTAPAAQPHRPSTPAAVPASTHPAHSQTVVRAAPSSPDTPSVSPSTPSTATKPSRPLKPAVSTSRPTSSASASTSTSAVRAPTHRVTAPTPFPAVASAPARPPAARPAPGAAPAQAPAFEVPPTQAGVPPRRPAPAAQPVAAATVSPPHSRPAAPAAAQSSITVPADLVADLDLDPEANNQGKRVRVTGELRVAPLRSASPSRYRLLDLSDGSPSTLCDIHGRSEELRPYIGKTVTIRGQAYLVTSSPTPVVVVGELIPANAP